LKSTAMQFAHRWSCNHIRGTGDCPLEKYVADRIELSGVSMAKLETTCF